MKGWKKARERSLGAYGHIFRGQLKLALIPGTRTIFQRVSSGGSGRLESEAAEHIQTSPAPESRPRSHRLLPSPPGPYPRLWIPVQTPKPQDLATPAAPHRDQSLPHPPTNSSSGISPFVCHDQLL